MEDDGLKSRRDEKPGGRFLFLEGDFPFSSRELDNLQRAIPCLTAEFNVVYLVKLKLSIVICR